MADAKFTLTRLELIITACDLREVVMRIERQYPDAAAQTRARADKFSELHAAMVAANLNELEIHV